MEHDRAQVDLGVAVDIEERAEESAAIQRQPKKRFLGRKQADNAARNGTASTVESSEAIQG